MASPHETKPYPRNVFHSRRKRQEPDEAEPAVWRERLRHLSVPPFLGSHQAGACHAAPEFAVFRAVWPGELNRRVLSLGQELELSADTILLAAWARILSAYNSSEQVQFGVKFSSLGRDSDRLWPLQLQLEARKPVSRWLEDVQEARDELETRAPVLLSDLRSWCEAPAGQPVLETLMDFHFSGAEFAGVLTHSLEVRVAEDRCDIAFVYRSRNFPSDFIQRLSEQFFCVLETMANETEQPVSSLSLLPPRQRTQILETWNSTETKFRARGALHELFEEQVERTPEAIALEFKAGAASHGLQSPMTYRELNSRANRLANYLRALGVNPEKRVGICLERSPEMVVSLLAVLKAGGAYVPLDPAYPVERLVFILQDAQLHTLLTTSAVLRRLGALRTGVLGETHRNELHRICLDAHQSEIARESDENPPRTVGPENLAYVIYTSGSTGRPKGVAIEHRNTLSFLHWARTVFTPEELNGVLASTSICFDLSVFELFAPLSAGGRVLLAENALELPSLPMSNEVRLVNTVPSAITGLLRMNGIPASVRTINLAGEPLSQSLVQQLYALRSVGKVYDLYGPSEDTTYSTFALRKPEVPATIGRPMANKQVYILDRHLEPVPIGVPGELCVGGDGLARGYLNRPELTAEKFIPNPFGNGARSRLYKTGDLARWRADGNIEFLGRIDHQVKVRGFRIELGEVEAVLSKHPHVRETVVVARDTDLGDKQLVAYLVPKDGGFCPAELRSFLRDRLPSYSIPSHFVVLPALPLTPNGKVDRRALPKPAETEVAVDNIKAPRDPLEIQLKLVFEKVLQRHPIGVDASFFELGGDSLQALRVIVEIEQGTGKKLPLEILYQAPTVESLAGNLRGRSDDREWSSLVALQPKGRRRPLFLIHTTPGDVLGYGNLIYHLDSDQPCYGFQSLGLCRAELSHTRIEEMAAYYAKLLRSVQPRGPYTLGGWCYGGIVAVEMAHQLLAVGESVSPLLLFETPAPAPPLRQVYFYARRIYRLWRMSLKQWRAYLLAKWEYHRGRSATEDMRFLRVKTATTAEKATDEEKNRVLAKFERVYRANMRALDAYRSRLYPGKIILFNATEPPPGIIRDSLYGWPGLAAEIEVRFIPGSHHAILMEPHVRVLAQEITQCLRHEQVS